MIEVTVATLPDHRDRLPGIAADLKAAGLRDVETRPRFGLIVGRAEPQAMAALRAVAGVRSIRETDTFSGS